MRAWLVAGCLLIAACKGSGSSSQSGDPAPGVSAPPSGDPVTALFVDLPADNPGKSYPIPECVEAIVTPVKGTAIAADEKLGVGDVLAVRGYGTFGMKGDGVALVARVHLSSCDDIAPAKHVVRASDAPELTFMGGAMHAHLDVTDPEVLPSAYEGRLSGTAAVAQHTHPGTWEVLCATEAAGTFTLAGAARRLGPRQCVTVPPDTPHSWQPDPGSNLVATQFYWPPGPEQRFRKLAADEASSAKAAPGDH